MIIKKLENVSKYLFHILLGLLFILSLFVIGVEGTDFYDTKLCDDIMITTFITFLFVGLTLLSVLFVKDVVEKKNKLK